MAVVKGSSRSHSMAPAAAPSPKEALLYHTILMENKNALDVDWNVGAAKSGYNGGRVAQTRFGQIKKKFQEYQAEKSFPSPDDAAPTKPKQTKKTGKAPVKRNGTTGKRIKVEIPVKRECQSEDESVPPEASESDAPGLEEDTESDEELNLSDHESDA